MISNRFYYFFTLLAAIFLLSSCLDSDDDNRVEYDYSSDAQITSLVLSSREDTLNVLSKVEFSINQVASAPLIFNKDSLPYLFDVKNAKMTVTTNRASGIKLHLISPDSPDSTYIWNTNDSVLINRLKHIEVYAADGVTTKLYTFQLNIHQQDPNLILWQNVVNNYIDTPTDQVTVANANKFYTYYNTGTSIDLATSSIEDGEMWTNETLTGLPQGVVLKSIQVDTLEESEKWYAMDGDGRVYISENGVGWSHQQTDLTVRSIYGKMPSYSQDSVLAIVKDGEVYKFAKTIDFSSMNVLNEIPAGFPVDDFAFTTVKDPRIYTAKYLVVTSGKSIDGMANSDVWIMQENDQKITFTSKALNFNVVGASMFRYDNKIYLLTSDGDKNVFYTSNNYGMFWEKADSKQQLPIEFLYRENPSVNVDDKNNIWIFGGVSSDQNQLVEIWKGRINKLFVR